MNSNPPTHSEIKESSPLPLTEKEKKVLEFIESFFAHKGFSPSFTEIKDHFGFASYNSVQRYIKQLQVKNYLSVPGGNSKRAISLIHPSNALQRSVLSQNNITQKPFVNPASQDTPAAFAAESLSLLLLGSVAAGVPIEKFNHDEFVEVPRSFVRNSQRSFALRVEGQSMIEDGIFDQDIIVVQKQENASNGEIVVANVDNESTVKRFYLHKEKKFPVELRPANSRMDSFWYQPEQVRIEGIVVGLLRTY